MEEIMERDGWNYDDLDEDYYYEDCFGNDDSRDDCLVSEGEYQSVQKRQKEKGD